MLELKNISFDVNTEGKDKEILRNIDLVIPDNKLIVVTGPNGGGKSTIARIIAGIERPTEGQLILNGEDITDATITERAKKGIGFAFQQPVKFKGITVKDLIRIALNKKVSTAEACDYLSQVGLCAKDYIDREVNGSLSGGELKRIEIATVLARASSLSIFDEPEAGIDLWSFQNLIEVFQNMRKTIKNSSILIISHQERILEIADIIVVVKDGTIVDQGPSVQILPKLVGTSMAEIGCRKLI